MKYLTEKQLIVLKMFILFRTIEELHHDSMIAQSRPDCPSDQLLSPNLERNTAMAPITQPSIFSPERSVMETCENRPYFTLPSEN